MSHRSTCDRCADSDSSLSDSVSPTSMNTVGSNEVDDGDW